MIMNAEGPHETDSARTDSGLRGSDRAASRHGFSRRGLLLGAGVGGAGVAAAASIGSGLRWGDPEPEVRTSRYGSETVPFFGERQAGIDTPAQAHALLIALDLREPRNAEGIQRLLRLLSDDASRLTAGRPALADTEPELAGNPASMTVTFGFGRRFIDRLDPRAAPAWLKDLPDFEIDELEPALCGGDLLLQLCGNNPISLAHARRIMLKSARSEARPRWIQNGFRSAHGAQEQGSSMRNLFGQVDETVQPERGGDGNEFAVWGHPPSGSASALTPWVEGGTSLVIRRIQMDMDGWDELARSGKESSVGRDLSVGAPLTGTREHQDPDFEATSALGFPVIEEFAHIRRARQVGPEEQILRRGYNYDDPASGEQISNSGLIFISYQADVDRQFLPIQRRLAEGDRLNEWTTPVGSAVFAVPPGCQPDGFIGDFLI
ncbi:Dyp-type peroxidase [Nesterenkonia sp. AY15]|uniref:Dyp-type peroxidase n=2 Tax=Nesterenkonia sp. AY15 TaxID=2901139 RepID=UPI001F4CA883|nr:Dyp-type peroxidase [Nesterenkonia sp. AY15]MCH8570884.1 Dyp-type peroxidase [Nesterenkonia sp. AY15]